MIPFLYKLLQKTQAENTLPNSFYEASITLKLKPEKENYKPDKEPKTFIS